MRYMNLKKIQNVYNSLHEPVPDLVNLWLKMNLVLKLNLLLPKLRRIQSSPQKGYIIIDGKIKYGKNFDLANTPYLNEEKEKMDGIFLTIELKMGFLLG